MWRFKSAFGEDGNRALVGRKQLPQRSVRIGVGKEVLSHLFDVRVDMVASLMG